MSKKILIINPGGFFVHTFPEEQTWIQKENFRASLLILYSYLKKQGIKSEVIDFEYEIGHPTNLEEINCFNHAVKDRLKHCNFDIAAISCYTSKSYLTTVAVANICKEINPHCTVVVGGNH